jgi:LacI family transcriptional regulator
LVSTPDLLDPRVDKQAMGLFDGATCALTVPKAFDQMATIRDVARLADVSISTVSLALNTPDRVSADTRRRVEEAARQVGFSANPIAQSLKRGRSRLIGMVVADITNPFFGRLLREIERRASEAGYMVVVCDTDANPETERAILKHLSGQRVAGLILSPTGRSETSLDQIRNLAMPFVLFDHRLEGVTSDYVGTDNDLAAAMLTEHLIRLGHRRIALIGGTPGLYTAERRRAGYEATLRAHGLPVDPGLVADGQYDGDGGYAAAMRLMTRAGERPTAILAASNVMGIGALQACNELSIRCPEDVSLAGIDDVPWSNVIRPRITASVQPIDDMARAACRMLMDRIAAAPGTVLPCRDAVLAPHLVIGGSTAPPPGPPR